MTRHHIRRVFRPAFLEVDERGFLLDVSISCIQCRELFAYFARIRSYVRLDVTEMIIIDGPFRFSVLVRPNCALLTAISDLQEH